MFYNRAEASLEASSISIAPPEHAHSCKPSIPPPSTLMTSTCICHINNKATRNEMDKQTTSSKDDEDNDTNDDDDSNSNSNSEDSENDEDSKNNNKNTNSNDNNDNCSKPMKCPTPHPKHLPTLSVVSENSSTTSSTSPSYESG